jgi:hypothetical protein
MRLTVPLFLRYGSVPLLIFLALPWATQAQTVPDGPTFSHKYSLGLFAEGSPTSSHMLLGYARERELVGVGAALTRRLSVGNSAELDYLIEVRPLLMESDPMLVSLESNQYGTVLFSPTIPLVNPRNLADPYNIGVAPFAAYGYTNAKFSRRWTYTGGASPFGLQLNGFKHSRIQPEIMANAGFLVSPRDIPIQQSSYFNFTFQVGGGMEWYRTDSQSLLMEYRYHHFSSKDLGTYNPGTDSGLWKLTYRFGRK